MRGVEALFLVAAVGLVTSAAAFAHGEDGVFSGTEAVPTNGDPLTVSLRARLLYVNDNEPAPGATVTVDAIGPSGATVAPAPLTDNGDGTYQGALVLSASGAWTLRFTATTPNAATEVAYTAEAPTTTVLPTTTTRATRPGGDEDDDDGSGIGALVLAVMAVAAVVAGGWLFWRRRRDRTA
ncbi:MAG: hypothetical protein ACT4PI_05030 [Actinomycetota bacterium]